MGWDFFICIFSLIGATALGLRLAVYNLKNREQTHELRMQIYRQRKRIKNERLRRHLGISQIDAQESRTAESMGLLCDHGE